MSTQTRFTLLFAFCILGLLQAQAPIVTQAGVVNAADNTPSFSPGTIVSIYGQNLATRTTQASAPLPTTLENTCAEILRDGASAECAPVYFVSPGQVNVQLPYSVVSSTVNLRVRTDRGVSGTVSLSVAARAPRLLTRTMNGRGDALLLHSDYALVTSESGAKAGEYLILYLIGLGAVSPPIAAGKPSGDGGKGGPLNVLTEPVTVLINGVAVTAAWAGLAPYYPGLYQVNFQAPSNLPAGELRLQVRCGQQVSQDLVVSYGAKPATEPSDIVGLLLEAQARGDVNGVLSLWAMEEKTLPAQQMVRERFEMVRRVATFSNVRWEPLATVRGDQGTISAVRGFVDYTIATRDGTRTLRYGLLAVLRKIQGAWKVTALAPDDLLNLELTVESSSAPSSARLASGPVRIKDINAAINLAMAKGFINETKAEQAGFFAVLGMYPGAGDAAANIYQVADTIGNAAETLSELWQYGPFSTVLLMKASQVAIGIAQIAAEPIPGLDTSTDVLAASVEQLTYNLEMVRALQELKKTLLNLPAAGVQINPRLFRVPKNEWAYPAGVEFVPAEGAEHSYGIPLGSISLTAPTVLGRLLPLQVIGELAINSSSPAYRVAEKLGGKLRDSVFFLPVDVGHLVESESVSEDQILDGWSRRRNPSSTGKWAVWDITCRRGTQSVAVRLRTGETTPSVTVRNTFMNAVQSLEIQGAPATEPYKLKEGERLNGLRVIGVGPLLEERFRPDLTPLGDCLSMAILDTTVAGIERGQTVTLSGNKKGQTTWKLLLGGAAYEPGIGDISRDVLIDVEQATSIVPLLRNMTRFGHTVYSIVTYSATDVGANTIGTFLPLPGLTWNGTSFSATADDSALVNAGEPPFKVTLSGTVSPDGLNVTSAHFKRYRLLDKQVADSSGRMWRTYDENLLEWDAGPLPVVVPSQGFSATTDGFVYEVKGAASNAVIKGFVYKRVTYDGWATDFSPSKLITRNITISFPADDRLYVQMRFFK
jgi:uncharacterized protein (TIGR03437 family)